MVIGCQYHPFKSIIDKLYQENNVKVVFRLFIIQRGSLLCHERTLIHKFLTATTKF